MQTKLKIDLRTENDAFNADPRSEAARILRELADKIERGVRFPVALMDENGNRVGSAVLR